MKNPQKGSIRWIWRHSGPYRRGIFAITALYVLASVNTVLFPVLFRSLIDSVTTGAVESFLLFGGIYGGLYGGPMGSHGGPMRIYGDPMGVLWGSMGGASMGGPMGFPNGGPNGGPHGVS